VFDGYSGALIMREIADAYDAVRHGRPVPPSVTIPYSQYVARKLERQAQAERDLVYWREVFASPPHPLDLPLDGARGATRSLAASTVHREMPAEFLESLRALARAQGCTLFNVLLAGYQCLLARLSGQHDIVVGVPAAGQAHLGLDAVGYCVNALPIRGYAHDEKPFSRFLVETRTALLDAMEHQDVGIGGLVRELRLPRTPDRIALTEVFFNFSSYLSDIRLEG